MENELHIELIEPKNRLELKGFFIEKIENVKFFKMAFVHSETGIYMFNSYN